MSTLLEQAKLVRSRGNHSSDPTEEEIDLALAHIRGEVTHTQVKKAMQNSGKTGSQTPYILVTRVILYLYNRGKISINL